jgi:uncharacterized protein YegL
MWFQRFLQDRRASVAPIFAIAIIPVIGFVGAAVDYSRANKIRTAMQSAIDSTALMLSKDALTLTQTQLSQKANDYFYTMFKHPDAKNLALTSTFTNPTVGNFILTMSGTARVDTTFTRVLGQTYMDVRATSEVKWGMKKLELALDNTGSMASSSKMTELKKAVHTLLDTLKKASKNPGDIKVAIIPFDTTVNIGTSYKDKSWFDTDSIDCNGWRSGNGCTSTNWKNYWEGCVRDRTYPYDVQDDRPSVAKYPVYDCGSLAQAMPLTSDWTALNNRVDDMNPNGNTNVTIGLVWAWHALTSNNPFNEAAEPASDLDKIIILLTDGDNTESWKNSNNTKVTTASAIDARTQLVCQNVKAAGIKLYTVRVIDGNASLLQGCATNPSMFYDVQTASQLNSVFSSIAQNLANLRISK